MTLPYPFVTQGATPIHVYSGLSVYTANGQTCLQPTGEIMNYQMQVTLASYGTTPSYPGSTYDVTLTGLPTSGFMYINIHLDYGLEKLNGWVKTGDNAVSNTTVNPTIPNVNIVNNTPHEFDSTVPDSSDTISNTNEFKKIKGFGGLVYIQTGTDAYGPIYAPLQGAKVELWKGTQKLGTMFTDADGWYLSSYVHKGKEATYRLVLVANTPAGYTFSTQTIANIKVGGAVKYGEGNFTIPQ